MWTPAFGSANSSKNRLDDLQPESPDDRTRVWWDPGLDFSIAMAEVVGTAPPFYDKILAYGPGGTWQGETPEDHDWLDRGTFSTGDLVDEVEALLPDCPGGVRTE